MGYDKYLWLVMEELKKMFKIKRVEYRFQTGICIISMTLNNRKHFGFTDDYIYAMKKHNCTPYQCADSIKCKALKKWEVGNDEKQPRI